MGVHTSQQQTDFVQPPQADVFASAVVPVRAQRGESAGVHTSLANFHPAVLGFLGYAQPRSATALVESGGGDAAQDDVLTKAQKGATATTIQARSALRHPCLTCALLRPTAMWRWRWANVR